MTNSNTPRNSNPRRAPKNGRPGRPTHPKRLVGVKNHEVINDARKIAEVVESLIANPTRWTLVTPLDWKTNGFLTTSDSIIVPAHPNGSVKGGDVVASIGDVIVNFNDGRSVIVFTPEIKERVERGDYTWFNGQ